MINGSALVGLVRRLGGSFQLLPHDPYSTYLSHYLVDKQANLIGASQEGQNKEETKQL